MQGGAFGEYLIAKGDLVIKLPDSITFEDAAPIGVSILTVGQGLYQEMGLRRPDEPLPAAGTKKAQVLVYGGSSAVGAVAIQFLKL